MKDRPEDYLTEEAINAAKNIRLDFFEEKEKYSKRQYAKIYKGYDFLENLLTVRTYIQKRYDINLPTLELLLKLMGMKIFTRAEFGSIPREFGFNRFKTVLKEGHIVLLSDHDDVEQRLFTLSTKSKNICVKFYQYLSGEATIPENYLNPMANRNKSVPFDKKKMELIKTLNKLPIKEHYKGLM